MPPAWGVLLEMTDGNLPQAMQLEDDLTAEWFYRWAAYNDAKNRAKEK